METQTTLAVPDEDNSITVYSSSQNPDYVHSTIARCLGIPENNVRVKPIKKKLQEEKSSIKWEDLTLQVATSVK